jgi:dimeric dUTPase (all-alpha-NTP-PPase superfamily)
MTFEEWLASTRLLQIQSFGSDPSILCNNDFAEYIRWNVLAAQVELAEFIQETEWKPWKDGNGRPGVEGRERAVEELVDVMHFVANLLVALNVTGPELADVYRGKQQVNRERQANRTGA